jgi:hypothetical protein
MTDKFGDAELINLLNDKAIMISGWNEIEHVKPHEEQPCKILIEFTFPIVKDSNVELIKVGGIFEGIYRGGTWVITKGDIPSGFVSNVVTKWIPLNEKEVK